MPVLACLTRELLETNTRLITTQWCDVKVLGTVVRRAVRTDLVVEFVNLALRQWRRQAAVVGTAQKEAFDVL